MQIDVKAGGKLWKVDLPTKNTMFLGIDTNHDSMCKRSSVGGFVASMDQDMTRLTTYQANIWLTFYMKLTIHKV